MDLLGLQITKPILVGFHLGFAIIGIDAFLWLLGELKNRTWNTRHIRITAAIGVVGFVLSWIFGGFYYVAFYGSLVKPVIKSGLAPWAHNIIMETKEHIFLFIVPLAVTAATIAFLNQDEFQKLNIRRLTFLLVGFVAVLGLIVGLMGFIISAAARWG